MARRNAVVEGLERQIQMLRAQIERMRKQPADMPFVACDNSCLCAAPEGMATNGGCRCDERKLRMAPPLNCGSLANPRAHLSDVTSAIPSTRHLDSICPGTFTSLRASRSTMNHER